MDRIGRTITAAVSLAASLVLAGMCCGCRARTTGLPSPDERLRGTVESETDIHRGDGADGAEQTEADRTGKHGETIPEAGDDRPDRTRERKDASRKEYDENAAVEIVEGTGRALHGEGEGGGMASEDPQAASSVSGLNDLAAETATLKVTAEATDRMGVSPDAPEADSAMVYYTVLLQDRLGSLFECKRVNAYLETKEDRLTVYRTSSEHQLLTGAGVYDVSGRLLETNLLIDDGWVMRKDPDLIVKLVDGSILGRGVIGTSAARSARDSMLKREGWLSMRAVRNRRVVLISADMMEAPYLRTAAMLIIAREAYPNLFADVDPDTALQQLAEEATGTALTGTWYLCLEEDNGS